MVHILKIEEYAKENNIPIMEKEGIEFLKEYIKSNNVENILEIGAAIGYSAINMALSNESIKVFTVERDENRYKKALENISEMGLENKIVIQNKDAFDLDLDGKYDLIFIDAAKSQYIKFFEKFKENLSDDGVIVSDNLHFHGLVGKEKEIKSRNVRGIVRKLKNYIDFLEENQEFETKFYDIGDGIAVSKKRTCFFQ
jgi:Predicted O-methyltransferase